MRDVDGSVAQNYCPRAGYVSLRLADAGKKPRRFTAIVRCKSWRCKPCKRAKIAVMSERIRQACSSAKMPYFVSVTYGTKENVERSSWKIREKYRIAIARSANKDWKEFTRRYERLYKVKLKWLRIPELTKKGMLHFHLIIDGMNIGEQGHRCETNMGKKFRKDVTCQCVTHQVSRVWADVTGFYVVDARPVYANEGMGTYLGGYLMKMTEKDYEWLAANGVTRRIECSRGFGRLPKLLRAAGIGGFDRVDFVKGMPDTYELEKTAADPLWVTTGGLWSEEQKTLMTLRKIMK